MTTKSWLSSLALIAAALLPASAEDWYRWRGPDLNGISKERDWTTAWPKEGPRQLWKANVGIGFSSFAVANGRAYTLGNNNGQDTVFAFDAVKGNVLWKHTYKCALDPRFYEGGTSSTPTVDGDRVYTLSKEGHVFCFDAASGKIQWEKNMIQELGLATPKNDQDPWWGFAGSPFVKGDVLFLNVGTAGAALDKKSGKVIWSTGKKLAGYSTPLPIQQAGESLIALATADAYVAVNEKDGKLVWSYPFKTSYDVIAADPVIAPGDRLFLSSGYGHGCALVQLKGKSGVEKVYENKTMKNHFNPSVLIDGHLYGIDGNAGAKDAGLRCLDLATGESKWFEKSVGSGGLMAADGKLIIQGDKGELVIATATPDGFRPLARAQILGGKCWTTPVLSNGRIYSRNAKGDVVCVDVRGGAVASR
jgi:outer membrane protein assembly factor BamB